MTMKWLVAAAVLGLVTAACDSRGLVEADPEQFPVALSGHPVTPAEGELWVCKVGPAGSYNFTIADNTPGGGLVTLPLGTSFQVDAGQCRLVATTTGSGTSATAQVTVTETGGPASTTFKEVRFFGFIPVSGTMTQVVSGTSLSTIQVVNAGNTFGPGNGFHADLGVVLVYENVRTPDTGCTLTLGFWKTHAGFHGNNTDVVTPLLPIWLGTVSGAKSVQVTTAAQAVDILSLMGSNGIDKLYSQLLAAKLNIAAGASAAAVASTIAAADAFLATKNAADWSSLSKSQKNTVLNWMITLDNYNNGLIGPGHCDDLANG